MWKVTVKTIIRDKQAVVVYQLPGDAEKVKDSLIYLEDITADIIGGLPKDIDPIDAMPDIFKDIRLKLTDHGTGFQVDSIRLQHSGSILLTLQ